MARRTFVDPRLKSLQEDFARFEADLGSRFKTLVDGPPMERFSAWRGILTLLAVIRARMSIFATSQLQTFYAETAKEISRRLGKAGFAVDPTATATATLDLGQRMLADVDRALASVRVLAQRGFDREFALSIPPSVIATLPVDGFEAATAKAFLDKAIEHQVTVPTRGGNSRAFGLAYYLSIVLASAFGRARNLASLDTVRENDLDLVKVSANPSTIGDFCDAYAGKVFSVSGNHPTAPPLARTVAGGPPFHVNCLHWLEPLPPDYSPSRSEVVSNRWLVNKAEDEARIIKDWGRTR